MNDSTLFSIVFISIACVLLGMYAMMAMAYDGSKKSECKMEAIRSGASIEIIELCNKN
jgi:hypothetical protein